MGQPKYSFNTDLLFIFTMLQARLSLPDIFQEEESPDSIEQCTGE